MQAFRGRAIAASAMPNEAAKMRELLIQTGFSEIVCVFDGFSALQEAQSRLTDLVFVDSVLPGMDAALMQKRLYGMPMTVYPAVISAAAPGTYPENADTCVLKRSVGKEAFENSLLALRPEVRPVPVEKRERIGRLLDETGIPEHCGREYLRRAIEMAWLDGRLVRQLTTRLYPAVAEEFKVDRRHVERSMRHAIDVAWRGERIEAQYRLFGDTIDAERGSPTLGEMIARIADILRWEGKA